MLSTPVAFLIFNRPDLTARAFAEIAAAKPAKLMVVADGARPNQPDDVAKVQAARAVIERVDWDCELVTLFSEVNLGCKRRVSSGLNWVFEQCEEAIILEDDCIPHPLFFRYCQELLERYRDDKRVPMICGSSFHHDRPPTSDTYYFSRLGHIWGWASWRRAWQHYDVKISSWPALRETSWLLDILGDKAAADYWQLVFDKTHAGEIDTWDYQWFFSWWVQNGLAIIPVANLVSNVGFGDDATHTQTAVETMSHLPTAEIAFPLKHPGNMVRNRETDLFAFTQMCPWTRPQPGIRGWLSRNLPRGLPGRTPATR